MLESQEENISEGVDGSRIRIPLYEHQYNFSQSLKNITINIKAPPILFTP